MRLAKMFHNRTNAVTFIATVTLTVGAGCNPGALQVPQAPSLDAEVAAYQSPSGTIDTARVDATFAAAQQRLADLHLDWLPDVVADLLGRVRTRLDSSGLADDPTTAARTDRPSIDAVATVTRTCRDAAGNAAGALGATAIVQDGRLTPVVWGTADGCALHLTLADRTLVDARLSGELDLYLYGPVPHNLSETQVLVKFSGMIGTADEGEHRLRLPDRLSALRIPGPRQQRRRRHRVRRQRRADFAREQRDLRL